MDPECRRSESPSNRPHQREEDGVIIAASSSSSPSRNQPQMNPLVDQSNKSYASRPNHSLTSDSSHRQLPLLSPQLQSQADVMSSGRLLPGAATAHRSSLPPRSSSLAALSDRQRNMSATQRHSPPLVASAPPSHADAFMASLMRAAQSREIELQPPRRRPMSVSSMVDSPNDNTEVNQPQWKRRRTDLTQNDNQDDIEMRFLKVVDNGNEGEGSINVLDRSRFTHLYHSPADDHDRIRPSIRDSHQPSPSILSMSRVSSPSLLQPLPRNGNVLPSYTATYKSPEIDRQMPSLISTPTFEWPQPSASSFTSSSSSSNSSFSKLHSLPSRSIYTNEPSSTTASSTRPHLRRNSSSGSSSINNGPSVFSRKSPASMSSYNQSRLKLIARATEEEQRWIALNETEKSIRVRDNILSACSDLVYNSNPKSQWPPNNTIVTSIRCMYANIAQKSYGSEKRFLCPPPVVKIDGPLRPCKWACARVVSGESPTPSSISIRSTPAGGISASGEEEALIDTNKEARFGKLHVGSLTESRRKTFRLQINLLRGEESDESIRASMTEKGQIHPDRVIAAGAWSTFHSAPISVISKPARKSARTRAASPAISSGSIVCLYNRLNSQTVRTKYLSVETKTEEIAKNNKVRKLIARPDGWEGFAIDLLARPVKHVNTTHTGYRANSTTDNGEIAYGSIICLRDVNTNVCSEPMLICRADKGKVDVSNFIGNSGDTTPMQFEMVGKDIMAVREILAGGRRKEDSSLKESDLAESSSVAAREESPERISESAGSATTSTGGPTPMVDSKVHSNNFSSTGGAVIQMQKVTLMQVSPRINTTLLHSNLFECDLASPRSYLCSTAFEGALDIHTTAALARSREQLQTRFKASQDDATLLDEDFEFEKSPKLKKTSIQSSSTFPVGFVRLAPGLHKGQTRVIDVLEDSFCWTIVTISQSEVSFIEANARLAASLPFIPTSLSPITPYPSVAALPSYDHQRHAISATIHDFHYSYHPQVGDGKFSNNVCAVGNPAVSNMSHEIWLGHSGPLNYRSTSAGSYMSDVIFQLPSLSHLQVLHSEFHGTVNGNDNTIRLPILFVRASQGITFISSHWLQATYFSEASSSSSSSSSSSHGGRSIGAAATTANSPWRLAIV